jgi:hypothetical protein
MSVLFLRLTLIHEDLVGAHGRAALQDVFHPWNPPFAEISALGVINNIREKELVKNDFWDTPRCGCNCGESDEINRNLFEGW